MTKKRLKEEESVAAATLKPNPSRPEMLSTLTQMLAQLGQEDLSHFFNDAMAQIGHEADNIPPGAAAQNAASIAAKTGGAMATKEDIAQIFGNDKVLTEEFTERATDVFNALVEAKTVAVRAELEEQYEQKLAEEAENVVSNITEVLDQYLNYVASEWVKENKLELESTLKNEIAESLMQGIYSVFVENNLNVPESKVDVVEALVGRVEALESTLEEETKNNIELMNQLQEKVRNEIFTEVSEGMTSTAAEKLKVVAESVDFVSEETFRKKLNILKESNFEKKASTKPQTLVEEELMNVDDEEVVENPIMNRYVQAISKTLVKD